MSTSNQKDRLKTGSFRMSLQGWWRTMSDLSDVRRDGVSRPFLFIELFVALSLSVTYYFLVGYFASGSPNNTTNGLVFSSCSIPAFHLQQFGDFWKARLSGLLISGWLFDFLVKNDTFSMDHFFQLFGSYQALWLFLLFLSVIFALRHSLLINLGIFAGLMYNFTPAAGLYFYPWDLPATLFFTLAVLFFERRQMLLMALAICAGCFFKETVLVCALLVLFVSHWRWGKRILVFAGIVAVYVLGKKFLLSQLSFQVAAISIGNATGLGGLFNYGVLIENLKALSLPTLNHAVFVNAGTLVAVLVLGWRRRFLPYMTVIVAFLVGQFIYGGINEFRIFMQILPLSLILLSERWEEHVKPDAAATFSGGAAPAWALRETFPALIPMTIVVIGLSTGIAGWRYYNIFENLQPDHGVQSELGMHDIQPVGAAIFPATEYQMLCIECANAELELGTIAMTNGQDSAAISYYERAIALNTNSASALNNLALLRATASNPQLRNGQEAVRLAERACQLTQYKEASHIRTLAAAYAEAGRFDDAVATLQKARAMALAQGQNEFAEQDEHILELFKSGQAFHHNAKPVP